MTFIMLELILLPVLGFSLFVLVWGITDLYKQSHHKTDAAAETQTPDE